MAAVAKWYKDRKKMKQKKELEKDRLRFTRQKYQYPGQELQHFLVEAYIYQNNIGDRNFGYDIIKLICIYFVYPLLEIGTLPEDIKDTFDMDHMTASSIATNGTWTNIDATNFSIKAPRTSNTSSITSSLPAMYEIFAIDSYIATEFIRNIHEYTNIDEYIDKYSNEIGKYDSKLLPFPTILVINIRLHSNIQLTIYGHMTDHLINNWSDSNNNNDSYKLFSQYMHNKRNKKNNNNNNYRIHCNMKIFSNKLQQDIVEMMGHNQNNTTFSIIGNQLNFDATKVYNLKNCDLIKYSNGDVFYISFDLVGFWMRKLLALTLVKDSIIDIGFSIIHHKDINENIINRRQDLFMAFRLSNVQLGGKDNIMPKFPDYFEKLHKQSNEKSVIF